MRRARLSQILATALGILCASGGGMLSMCGTGAEVNGVKISPTGIRIDQVNISGGGGQQGMDDRAGQRGATEYEGTQLNCRDDGSGTKTCW